MLTDYLDFQNNSIAVQPAAQFSAENNSDVNSFFVRRKTAKPKKTCLFKFENSNTSLSKIDYLRERKMEGEEKDKVMVCSPNPHNITPIYSPLMEFIAEIEKALKCPPGSHCTLYAFLMDYIKEVFLAQINVDNGNALNQASLNLDSWKSETDIDLLRTYKASSKSLLISSIGIKNAIDDLFRYMNTLPLYSDQFLINICNIVMHYKEISQAAYRGVIQPDSEDKRIISAQWAKDEDISRYLRSLPNWKAAMNEDSSLSINESLQEVEQRNAKETSILKGNLGEQDIPKHEILAESNQLRSLAHLHESMDWFAKNIILKGQFTPGILMLRRKTNANYGNLVYDKVEKRVTKNLLWDSCWSSSWAKKELLLLVKKSF